MSFATAMPKPLPSALNEKIPTLCRRAGRVSATLTRGQMNLIDNMVASGLFTSRADVLRYLIAGASSVWRSA